MTSPYQVRSWKRRSCGDIHQERESARLCCNDRAWEEAQVQKKRTAMVQAKAATFRFMGSQVKWTCPYKRCGHTGSVNLVSGERAVYTNEVQASTGRYVKYIKLTRETRIARTKALAKAQLVRHLRTWSYGHGRN